MKPMKVRTEEHICERDKMAFIVTPSHFIRNLGKATFALMILPLKSHFQYLILLLKLIVSTSIFEF